MTWLLVSLTVVEVALALSVLVLYVVLVTRHLRIVSHYLAKIVFGVRAVDTQTSSIGPSVVAVNQKLNEIDAALASLAAKAKRAG
jgi:hypothetical protein